MRDFPSQEACDSDTFPVNVLCLPDLLQSWTETQEKRLGLDSVIAILVSLTPRDFCSLLCVTLTVYQLQWPMMSLKTSQ